MTTNEKIAAIDGLKGGRSIKRQDGSDGKPMTSEGGSPLSQTFKYSLTDKMTFLHHFPANIMNCT